MAISLLDSGNSGAVATSATTTVGVTVSAGAGNRKLLVGITLEDFTGNAAPATVTFNGQELVALGLAVPGATNNQQSACRTIFFEQFEGGMPAPGSHNITVTWTATTGGAVVAYWLVDGVRQDQLATGGANGSNNGGASGTTLTTSITAGDTGAFLASVAYRNNTGGTLQLTAPGSSTTSIDTNAGVGGSRLSAGHKLAGLTAGANNATWTFASTTDRRSMAVVVVNPITAAILTADATFTAQSATSLATLARARQASAAFTAQAATSLATLSRGRAVAAAFVAQAATSLATLLRTRNLTAAFTAQAASSLAQLTIVGNKSADAAFTAQAASSSATLSRGRAAAAAFTAQSASSLATLDLTVNRTIVAAFQAQSATSLATLSVPPPPPFVPSWRPYRRGRPTPSGLW